MRTLCWWTLIALLNCFSTTKNHRVNFTIQHNIQLRIPMLSIIHSWHKEEDKIALPFISWSLVATTLGFLKLPKGNSNIETRYQHIWKKVFPPLIERKEGLRPRMCKGTSVIVVESSIMLRRSRKRGRLGWIRRRRRRRVCASTPLMPPASILTANAKHVQNALQSIPQDPDTQRRTRPFFLAQSQHCQSYLHESQIPDQV